MRCKIGSIGLALVVGGALALAAPGRAEATSGAGGPASPADMLLAGLPEARGAPLPGTGATAIAWVCKKAGDGLFYWFNCNIVNGREVCTQTTTRCTP